MDIATAIQRQVETAEAASELNPHIRRVLGRTLAVVVEKLATSESLDAEDLQSLYRDARGAFLFAKELDTAIARAVKRETDVH